MLATDPVPTEHPITGEVFDASDVDELADLYVQTCRDIDVLVAFKATLRELIAEHAKDQKKATRRVRGERYRIKVVMPRSTWVQGPLKAAWAEYPKWAPNYIRIATLAPEMREVEKLRNEAGGPRFDAFKELLLSAEEPAKGLPTITVEEGKDDGSSDT